MNSQTKSALYISCENILEAVLSYDNNTLDVHNMSEIEILCFTHPTCSKKTFLHVNIVHENGDQYQFSRTINYSGARNWKLWGHAHKNDLVSQVWKNGECVLDDVLFTVC